MVGSSEPTIFICRGIRGPFATEIPFCDEQSRSFKNNLQVWQNTEMNELILKRKEGNNVKIRLLDRNSKAHWEKKQDNPSYPDVRSRVSMEIHAGKKGFTLIELLIVVAIIAILAAIAVPNFLEAQVRAKVSRAKADIRSLATALESYVVDNNNFPPDVTSVGGMQIGAGWNCISATVLLHRQPTSRTICSRTHFATDAQRFPWNTGAIATCATA